MKRFTTLAAVAVAAIASLVSASSASAGCHSGYCGPRYAGYGYGQHYGYGFRGHDFSGFDFSRFTVQERLVFVKQFPQLEKTIFPNGIPANGAVGGGIVNGVAPAVGGAVAAPGGVVPAAGVAGAAVPAVGGVAPVAGAAAPAGGPAPVAGAVPAGAPVPAGAAPGAAAAAAAAAGTPAAVPVSDALAPILGKWVNTVTDNGKDVLTEIELKSDGTADVTVDSGLGRVTLNRRFAVEEGNFTLINGEAKQVLGSVVTADKDKVVLKKGEVELAFTRP